MRVLVCGGRDFANWPGHSAPLEDKEKYTREHALLCRTMDQFCIDRGLYVDEDGITPAPSKLNPSGNWLPHDLRILTGAGTGADTDIIDWCVVSGVPWEEFPADWKKYGKKAGPIRNQQMLDEGQPEVVIAFPGGRGTADMVRRAKKKGIEVIEIP